MLVQSARPVQNICTKPKNNFNTCRVRVYFGKIMIIIIYFNEFSIAEGFCFQLTKTLTKQK